MILKYKNFINESLRDKMSPKSKNDLEKSIDKILSSSSAPKSVIMTDLVLIHGIEDEETIKEIKIRCSISIIQDIHKHSPKLSISNMREKINMILKIDNFESVKDEIQKIINIKSDSFFVWENKWTNMTNIQRINYLSTYLRDC